MELDFLMDVERSDQIFVTSRQAGPGPEAGDLSGASDRPHHDAPRHRYGLTVERWRDMALHLLMQNLIVGDFSRSGRPASIELELDRERDALAAQLVAGQTISVNVSHAGRVHLWNLRDALLRDPDIEPFGLRSRAAWDRDLFVRLRWASAESPLSLIFLDLDNFGAVNKTLGAPIGDAVLRVVFGLVKNIVGTRGAAYRYGGEEVGVLLPDIDAAGARALAEELRVTIERDTRPQVPQLAVNQTASIGVATFTGPVENDAAVARVDEMMRAAKQDGKNRVVTPEGQHGR